jgi:large exoprotein involved in heme utilization and adhesion
MTIDTRRLTIRDGARLSTSTFGNGKAGDMTINASDFVEVAGSDSILFAQVTPGAQGNGGTMTIDTRRLTVRDGAQLTTSTFGNGKAGDLIIRASESVDLNRGSLFATAQSGATGNGGNLTINTGELKIQNGATVNVSSQGTGRAGNLNITARSIELNRGTLRAETASGKGGDIALNVQDLLLLRNESQISTNAGNPDTPGEGGNITINAPDSFIVAVPIENSDITANAFGRQGGRVSITVQDIFGIQPRDNLTPDSDITASSDIGINGEIIIQKLSFDISRGLVELPQEVINPEDSIASRCSTARRRTPSRFVDTGRGSLPPNPIDAIGEGTTPQSNSIVEAQGWIRVNGKVKLTNQVPMAQPYSSWETPSACPDDTR